MALAQDPITGKTPLETSMCLLLFGIGGSWALQGEAETFLRDEEVVTTNDSSRCGQNMPLNLRSTQAEKSLIDKSALEIK